MVPRVFQVQTRGGPVVLSMLPADYDCLALLVLYISEHEVNGAVVDEMTVAPPKIDAWVDGETEREVVDPF